MSEGVKLTKASCTRTTWRDCASIATMALLTLLNAASPHPTPWLLILGGLGCGLLAGTMWRDEWWKHRLKNSAGRAAPKPGEQAVSKETLKPCPFCGRAPKWVEIADARSAEMVGPWRKLTCSSGWNDETCRVSPFLQYHTDKWVQGKGTSRVNRDAEFGRIWNARAEGPAPPGGARVLPEDFDHLKSIRRKLVFRHAASAHEFAALARFEAVARAALQPETPDHG